MTNDVTILLVEDSTLMRRLVREMLRTLGTFHVLEAAHGADAISILESNHVDVVVSDWGMAPVDGLHLLQTMKARPALAKIPFVMMTGEQHPQIITQAVAAGVGYYLTKPFGRDQLGKMLSRVLTDTVKAA